MNIDWFTFAAQIVNFAALIYLLNRFLYKPITSAMSKREAGIASQLKLAELEQKEAKAESDRFRQLSDELENQRNVLFEQARVDSDETRKALVADARTEVESRRDDWMKSLHREQKSLINLIRQRVTQQVVAVSRTTLKQLADADLEEQTLATFLKQLERFSVAQVNELKAEFARHDLASIVTAFDISPAWKTRIREKLGEQFGWKQIAYITSPELICGIELHINGRKIGWSMQEQLESLTDELQGLLASET